MLKASASFSTRLNVFTRRYFKVVEKIIAFTAPQVVTDTMDITDDFGGLMDATGNSQLSPTGDSVLLIGDVVIPDIITTGTVEPPMTIVQLMPCFNGGEEAMYTWLGSNIKYPAVAKEANISGTVVVTFVVEKDGSITGVQLLRDIGGGCGDEAMRVVKQMPKWKEGRQNNLPVRVQFNLPIKFSLE